MNFITVKTQFDEEYLLLLNFLKKIFEKSTFDLNSEDINPEKLVGGLGVKIFYHLATIYHLSRGTNLTQLGGTIGFLDHSSTRFIVRAAFETHLTFYKIFIKTTSDTERGFLLKIWSLGGLRTRNLVQPNSEETKKIQALNAEQIKELRREIMNDPHFKSLDDRKQNKAREGIIPSKNFNELAVEADYSEKLFEGIYGMASAHAHSGIASVEQIINASDREKQIKSMELNLQFGMIVMGKFIYHYWDYIGEKNKMPVSEEEFIVIKKWEQVGKQMYKDNEEDEI